MPPEFDELPIPHADMKRVWLTLDQVSLQLKETTNLVTRLGCTIENLSQTMADGTPRCATHEQKLADLKSTVDLLASGKHPAIKAAVASTKNSLVGHLITVGISAASLGVAVYAALN